MQEITSTITHCPICETDWDFMYYDGVFYFVCDPCDVCFESYDGINLRNELEMEDV